MPDVGSTSLLTQRIRVDFPAPEGPISARTCASGISRSTWFRAKSPVSYLFVNALSFSIGLHVPLKPGAP